MELTDKDQKLIDKIKNLSDAQINQKKIWGGIFLIFSCFCLVGIIINLIGNSGNGISNRVEVWAIIGLLCFTLGLAAIKSQNYIRIIKLLADTPTEDS